MEATQQAAKEQGRSAVDRHHELRMRAQAAYSRMYLHVQTSDPRTSGAHLVAVLVQRACEAALSFTMAPDEYDLGMSGTLLETAERLLDELEQYVDAAIAHA